MVDDKKIVQQLKGIMMFFFSQPIIAFSNSSSYNDFVSLGALLIMSVMLIGIGLGLRAKKEWARKTGIAICVIQGLYSVAALVWFPSYFRETVPGDNSLWIILLIEAIILLFSFVYFLVAWRLNTVKMKEYFLRYSIRTGIIK